VRVAIVGATGLIGRRVAGALARRGDDVLALSRSGAPVPGARPLRWDPAEGPPPAAALEGVDALVNVAGAPIAPRRWTDARKRELRDSRLVTTRRVVEALAAGGPRVLVNASGVNYYGDAPHDVDESSPPGRGFLAELCVDWEAEARRAEAAGVRVALLRSGIVLAPEGGSLPRLALPARLGLAGPIGGGRQWLPWIHVADEVGIILLALDDGRVSGPLNLVAPAPVRQREFARTLGRVLRRPAALPTPAAALRLALGQLAEELLLQGQRAVPRAALAAGYRFRFDALEPALRAALGR
jgi:uncharacterized protein (TIGR01777 family)